MEHTKTVAKATETREETMRAENIIQLAGVKESEFKRVSVAMKERQKKWVAVRGSKDSR